MLGSFDYEVLIGFELVVPDCFPSWAPQAAAAGCAAPFCAEVFVLFDV